MASPCARAEPGRLRMPRRWVCIWRLQSANAMRHWSTICRWQPNCGDKSATLFRAPGDSDVWDYAKVIRFCNSVPAIWMAMIDWRWKSVQPRARNSHVQVLHGFAQQHDAATQVRQRGQDHVSIDPPYYDNIGYADLSDFFYVWLRRSLRHPFQILSPRSSVPKAEELVATRYRHGSRERRRTFFLDGMTGRCSVSLYRLIQPFQSPSITPSSSPKAKTNGHH